MGFRFQRRINILPGLRINLSKSGIGFSVGGRGFHAGVDSNGRRYTSAGLPGTGISWREYKKANPHAAPPALPHPMPTSSDAQLNPHTGVSRDAKNVVLAIVISLLLASLVWILTHLPK